MKNIDLLRVYLDVLSDMEQEVTSIDISGRFKGSIKLNNEILPFHGSIIKNGYYRIIEKPADMNNIKTVIFECQNINDSSFLAVKNYEDDDEYYVYNDEIHEAVVIKTLNLLSRDCSGEEIKEIIGYSCFKLNKNLKEKDICKKMQKELKK